LIAAGLGLAFDSFDTYVVAYAMPSIIREWKIDPITNGLLTSAGFWGMMLGAIAWGPFTDKFGRRIGFIGTILGFASLSGFTALASNVYQFGILRFVTGMCLGGMIPIDTALTSEFIAARYRGRFVAFMTVMWPFGLLAAAILSLTLVTQYGWRLLFVIGVVPAFLSFWIRAKVPESPRWLAIKGRLEEAKSVLKTLGASESTVQEIRADDVIVARVPVRTLLQPEYFRRFILTAGYYFFSYFGYYGFVLWLPSILATVYHLSLVKTFTYTLLCAIAAITGRVVAFYTIEKFGRKQLFYVGFGFGGAAALVFGRIQNPALLVWGACL
jgi:putative MFS transporter